MELALDLLRSGEAEVIYQGVSLHRSTAGPRADGQVHVSILSRAVPPVPPDRQMREISEGREVVAGLVAADGRLRDLLDECGSSWSYVYDYGNGRVLIEAISEL